MFSVDLFKQTSIGGNILGSAGPEAATFIAGKVVTLTGFMEFDTGKIAGLDADGTLQGVIVSFVQQ